MFVAPTVHFEINCILVLYSPNIVGNVEDRYLGLTYLSNGKAVEYLAASTESDIQSALADLAHLAETVNAAPAIFFEFHGSKSGLELTAGNWMSYSSIAAGLSIINRNCGNKAIAIFGCCYALAVSKSMPPATFIQFDKFEPRSPICLIIAPGTKIDDLSVNDLLFPLIRFLADGMSGSVDAIMSHILAKVPEHDIRYISSAGLWRDFIAAYVHYVEIVHYSSLSAIQKLIANRLALYLKLSPSKPFAQVAYAAYQSIFKPDIYLLQLRHYHKTYFMIDERPKNAELYKSSYADPGFAEIIENARIRGYLR